MATYSWKTRICESVSHDGESMNSVDCNGKKKIHVAHSRSETQLIKGTKKNQHYGIYHVDSETLTKKKKRKKKKHSERTLPQADETNVAGKRKRKEEDGETDLKSQDEIVVKRKKLKKKKCAQNEGDDDDSVFDRTGERKEIKDKNNSISRRDRTEMPFENIDSSFSDLGDCNVAMPVASEFFSEQTTARKKKHKKSKLSSNVDDNDGNIYNFMSDNDEPNMQLENEKDENCIKGDVREHVMLKEKKRKKAKRKNKDRDIISDAVDYVRERSFFSEVPHSSSKMEADAEQSDLQSSTLEINDETFVHDIENMLAVSEKIITSAVKRKTLNRRSTSQSAEAILQRRRILVTPEEDEVIHPCNINSVRFELKLVKVLEKNGIYLREGKWAKEEDDHLCKNLQAYLNGNSYYQREQILFAEDFTERKEIQKFLRNTGFYKQLAFRLNRLTYACYRRVRLLHVDIRMKGKFSEEEVSELIRLIQLHGNKWKKIAELMGRSSQNIIDKVRNLEGHNKGPWSETESQLLLNSVDFCVKQNCLDTNDECLPWTLIALNVPGRNGNQCRYHWLLNLRNTVMSQEDNKWSSDHDLVLLNSLREQNLENENEINWKLIQNSLGKSYSVMFLKHKWYNKKKACCVHEELTFNELLEVL